MADSGGRARKTKTKDNKKRKLWSPEQADRPPKTHCSENTRELTEFGHVEELERREPNQEFLEEGSPWRNLQLILLLQNKELDLQKKVELAFCFVKMRATEEGKGADQDYQPVKLSRLIVFLNDWIQSLLIPSERKMGGGRQKPQGEVFEACLDFRCWEIFLFCLEQSLKLQVSLHFSRNLLRSFSSIAKNAVSLADDTFLCSQESLFIGEDFKMYIIVLNCMPFVFASHGGFSNENLELWISTVDAVLDLVLKVYAKKLDSSNMGVFTLRFSCLVLEPFANFLRIHPARKTGFHGFIDKLLEPLMHLLGVLNLQIGRSNSHWTENLLKQVREVLSSGLFHPVHIDGFLSLHSTEKYAESPDGKPKNTKTVIKSYHRHLFEKLEKVLTEKKVSAIASFGELFCLLVHRVKVLKRTSGSSPDTKMMGKTGASRQREDNSLDCEPKTSFESSSVPQHNNRCPSSFNADTRKSFFDFFVQIMEPLLLKIDVCAQVRLEVESDLMGVHSTLKSMNSLLASFVHEMVYVRTEDTSEGACFNFLKKVYDIVMSFSTNLLWSAKYVLDNQKLIELLTFSANEVLVTVGHLLEIEYEVIGNDLLSLWLMMFSYSAVALSLVDMVDQSSLPSKIEALGCQLVNLYSQLRQVSDAIFALSKAARLVISRDDDHEINYNGFIAPLPSEAYARSVGMLLSSQEFKGAVCVAIRSIPEGQASGCVRQLTADISESLEWLKTSCSVVEGKEVGQLKVNDVQGFDLQAEILGRVLSELYALVVNSVTVTTGNSSLLGASIKDLMTLLHPCLNCLFGIEPDSVNKFLFTVTGRNLDIGVVGNKGDMPKSRFSTYRVFLFFFQLYMCCRSLYRQAISLMPPDVSRKMSEGMGDSFTAYCGKDWIERTELDDKGYFSWILQSSASLLAVIQSVSNIYLHSRTEDCYPLLYVLHAMALQRLVDLNREIKSLEYLLQRNDNLVQNNLVDGAAVSLYRKKSRRMEKRISLLRKEAAGLTDFIMGHLSFLANDQQLMSDGATCMDETKEWDFGICTINKKSLPTAIWWILCQNVDIWCTHASKKKMKLFLSVLIHTSLPLTSNYVKVGMQNNNVASQLKQITISQISSELLSDSIFYEQKIVRRYFVSRFCHVLEKSASLLSRDFSPGNVDLNSLPHWPQVLDVLEKSLVDVCSNKQATDDCLFVSKPLAHSSDKLPTEIFKEQTAILSVSTEFTACRSLLNLLCSMPKEYLNSKSLLRYETYLLNLERFVVGRLLECQGTLNLHSYQELFRLFVSCRKALKYIITTACDKRTRASDSSFIPTFPDDSLFALWLCKSAAVVVGLQQAVSEDNAYQVKDLTFALMDHTSYVFLTLSKHQFSHSVQDLFDAKKLCKEQTSSGTADQRSNFNESNRSLEPTNCVEAWKSAFLVSKTLMEQAQNFLTSSRDAFCTQKLGLGDNVVKLKTFSSVVSCFSGFLWGLASAINDASTRYSDNKVKLSGLKSELVLELNLCINVFEKFISSFLYMFLIDDQQARSFLNTQCLRKLDYGQNFVEAQGTSLEGSHAQAEISSNRQQQILAAAKTSASIDIDDDSGNASLKRSQLKDANFSATLLTEADSFNSQCLNKALLQNLLKGDTPEAAFALRQLLIGSSAILKLKLHINKISSLSSLVAFFVGISQVLLSSFVDMVETPQPFCFVWLDGVVKYLEELGNHFPSASPTLSGNVYAKLIELQLRAVGKCITLQGKRATLASHETESSTKTLYGHIGLSEASNPHGPYSLDEFKSRLRMSFKMFIKKPSELNLLSAIQAIERALVGGREQCTMIYDITTGNIGGGKVSSIVAAGIDCFDLVLEYVSGRKRLSVLKTHIQGLVAGLFNIILHLESPSIFYVRSIHSKGDSGPDPGAVILMCVEVLTRVSGKHALFQMAAWHVGQVLRIPGALFQDFCRLELSDAPISSHSSLAEDNQVSDPVARDFYAIDRCFSVDLFAACCRLLYTVLKHHKSECERSIALLEASVSVLLNCLEMVDADSVVRKEYFSWELEEGVKCACFLRRIYEEIRQQKDVLGRHCSQFLSNYIWVYSGYGPLKTGIRREIDEALRPGLYALVDACSADDLQYLHTVFGEGPCRNTLATLRHDYKLNFQYAGKV